MSSQTPIPARAPPLPTMRMDGGVTRHPQPNYVDSTCQVANRTVRTLVLVWRRRILATLHASRRRRVALLVASSRLGVVAVALVHLPA